MDAQTVLSQVVHWVELWIEYSSQALFLDPTLEGSSSATQRCP